MARHDYSITTIQAKTIISLIEQIDKPLNSRKAIREAACDIIVKLRKDFPEKFPMECTGVLLAFTLSNTAKYAIKKGDLSCFNYLRILANIKQENTEKRNDFGAFGDLFEILARLALVKNLHLVNYRMLSVKAIGQNDIVSKKYGKIECGTNGKTWTGATLYDYMAGDFNAVIYGVFSDALKDKIFDYCKSGKIEKAITLVSYNAGIWEDKYIFQSDMDNLTRGAGIALKGENVQCQYNAGKNHAFLVALKTGKFTRLYDALK